MTREEIKSGLSALATQFNPFSEESKLMLGAVEALEQEPCEDAISRQAVLEYIEASDAELGHSSENELVCQDIKELPPVTPQPKTGWIPVSEGLPKKSGDYWCTFGITNRTGSDYYITESDAKKFFDDPEEYVGWQSQNVIAWMPLPKPYESQESEG